MELPETVALLLSAIGHACWDYELSWMATEDPDASIIHMHWLRMLFMAIILQPFTWHWKKTTDKSTIWWVKFALVGFVIPSILYTHTVVWTGYRISVSFQSFIPLFVVLRKGIVDEQRASALILTMFGTLCIWSSISWQAELWMVWASMFASMLQVVCLSEFFIMLSDIKTNKMRAIVSGLTMGVAIMFFIMIIWTPYHFISIVKNRLDRWLLILAASAAATGIKFWLIAHFSERMSADGVAIFECIHPIATLFADIVRGKDIFEWEDVAAVTLFSIGWILYPKTII